MLINSHPRKKGKQEKMIDWNCFKFFARRWLEKSEGPLL
jgi:hypothetical protein